MTKLYKKLEVVEERGRIANGAVAEFQVTIKIEFRLDRQ